MGKNIEITNNAIKHISKILKADNAKFFRISVLGGGCAGFQYKFDFDNNINQDDNIIDTSKFQILIDKSSMELIKGSTIDYVQELIGSTFKISNPQASSSCGCGTSFSL
mgnify:CR=1 FL=1